ncbi:MAG: Ig-like domain-containing protein [Bacteroidales bacterium]|nr:Ig-like domain-containing protein [Bacteroidales bacterium]
MKSLPKLLIATTLLACFAVSCYDETAVMDKINGLDSRISALEQQMRTANDNISSLQTITAALQKNVSVSSVTEVDGGYKIVFSDGTSATIKNGTDGRTPSMGVKQDADGVYYWTLDGNWLLDSNGKKLRVTGENGKDGASGADAISPQLKIEKGYWYVSTDGGATWSQMGKATGEDGDAWFTEVKWDDDYVYLTLADGTLLKLRRGEGPIISIAAIPDYNDGSVKAGTGLFTIRFNVEPAGSAESLLDLAKDCFKLKAVYTLTKAEGDIITLPIHKRTVKDGILTITTTGEDLAPEFASKKLGVNAALFISDDIFAVNTGYFPLWPVNEYMGHEYVDLGLKSGNMWAETNLGAENPGEPGNYYSWGELTPKDNYTWGKYLWCNGTDDSITKYNLEDGKVSLKDYGYEDDAARKEWGGEWRIPTADDWAELMDKTKFAWAWTYRDGSYGYEIKSKKGGSDQSIFLPTTGHKSGTDLICQGQGYYWTSNLWSKAQVSPDMANFVVFKSPDWEDGIHSISRSVGIVIRPVLGKYEDNNVTGISITPETLTLAVGMSRHLIAKLEPEHADNPKVTWSSSNPGVATVSEDGVVIAVAAGTANITVKSVDGGYTATCAVTVKDKSAFSPEAVDLGFPSGVKWATFNVGAISPEDYGDYFAWGETEPYYLPGYALDNPCKDWKSDKTGGYVWGSYKWSTGNTDQITKYNNSNNESSFKDYNYQDDPARVNWGGEWRTPTRADMSDLQDYCVWTQEVVNNIFGCRITSKINGNSIFIPAGGHREDMDIITLGTECNYMTATGMGNKFYFFLFHKPSSGFTGVGNGVYNRCYGVTVRPVLGEEKVFPITGLSIDQTEITLAPGETCKLHAIVEPETATFKHFISWSCTDNGVVKVESGLVTALKPGQAIVTVQTHDGEFKASCTVTVNGGSEDPQDVVDLGLPSGVKWAKCNLGAKSEEEYGDYFAWGETEPYYQNGYALADNPLWKSGKNAGYDWPSYRWCNGDWDKINKYNTNSYYGPTVDNITTVSAEDDAAAVALGGGWRMPTSADWEDLMNPNNCEWTWTTSGGVLGYKVTSHKTKESIFLPACGRRVEEILDLDEKEIEDANGYYWSSTLSEYSCNALARCFFKDSQSSNTEWYDEPRCYGLAIRPVLDVAQAASSVERQWVYEYESQGETIKTVYDFGASFPHRLFTKEEPLSSDVLPSDQFEGNQYSIVKLPDGGVKVYSDDPRLMWYVFYGVTATAATLVKYYSSDYYTKEDIYNIWDKYPEEDQYGLIINTITVKTRDPFEKLKWEQWVLEVDGYKYRIYGSDYDNVGGDQYKLFVNSVLHGQACSVPIVRMNNYGSEEDFAKVDVKDKIAVIDRGDLTFSEKYENASKAGAMAVICANSMDGHALVLPNLAGVSGNVKKIPFVTVIKEAGERLNGKSTATFTWCTEPGEIEGY